MQGQAGLPFTRNWDILVRVDWVLVGIEFLGLLYTLYAIMTESSNRPEATRGLGVFFILIWMFLLGAAAFLVQGWDRLRAGRASESLCETFV